MPDRTLERLLLKCKFYFHLSELGLSKSPKDSETAGEWTAKTHKSFDGTKMDQRDLRIFSEKQWEKKETEIKGQ